MRGRLFFLGQRLRWPAEHFSWPAVFTLYAVLWAVTFWPAIDRRWSFMDDYKYDTWSNHTRWEAFLREGRPVACLWTYTLYLDWSNGNRAVQPLLRCLQGAMHVLAATSVAFLLWREIRSVFAVLAPLPFLLWCFSTEYVLWRVGAVCTLSCLLSVLGLCLIRVSDRRWRRLAGCMLIVLAILTYQSAAMAALVVWVILTCLELTADGPFPWQRLGREGLLLMAGYVAGAMITLALTRIYVYPETRANLSTNYAKKWQFLKDLNRTFLLFKSYLNLFPDVYPRHLRRAHVGLLGGVLLLTALHRGGPDRWGFRLSWRALAACLGLGLCLVLPYAPHLLVEESWVQLRALQLAPLLFAGLVAVGHRVTARAPVLRLGGLVALGVMLTAYYRIARIDTRDYVRNYAGDRAVLRDLEAYAAAHRTDRVYLARGILAAWQWNPYRLKYVNYCNHYSFFKTPWTKDNFVRRHSRLRPLGDDEPALAARAEEQARRLPPRLGVQFFLIDGSNVVGVYTP